MYKRILIISLAGLFFISSVRGAELEKATLKIMPPPEALPKEVLEKLIKEQQRVIEGERREIPQREKEREEPERTTAEQEGTPSAKITLNVSEMEIINVLKILANKGDLNIVASRNVQGRATIFLRDISIIEALDVICEVNNLAYQKEGNLVKVMTDREYEQLYGNKAYDRRIFKTLEIKHAKANSILQVLNGLKNNEGRIFVDERTNKLIIIELPEMLKLMEETISTLDLPATMTIFTLTYANPKDLEPRLRQILTRDGEIQVDSLNKKIIITDVPEKVEEVAQLIKAYDDYPPTETLMITLNYAEPDEIKEKIKDELTKEVGIIKVDKRTSQIIVTDLPQKIVKIKEFITACDTPTKEVLIEAKVVQVALSDQFKLGIDWEYLAKKADNLNIKAKFGALANTEPGGRISAGVLDTDDYRAVLDALKTIGNTKLISTPRITVTNNAEAKILVGSNVPYTTEETIYPQGGGNPITTKKVTYIDVGIKLYVTPQINQEGFVTMKIKPEVSSVTRYVDNNIPVVEISNVESTVMIKDGQTIIIAGLVKEEKVAEVTRIPFLGNIPFLGYLFSKTITKTINSELVIFLTPRIITGEGSSKNF